MRTFSEFEKRAMKIIAQQDVKSMSRQNFATLIKNLFYGISVDFDINIIGNTVTVYFRTNDDIEKIFEIIEQLISIIVLFQYLESQYLIKLHNTFAQNFIDDREAIPEPIKYIVPVEIQDEGINEYLCEHWTDSFFATEALKEFVLNDNYKSKQQIQHEEIVDKASKQVCYARWTFIIAIIAMILSFTISLISSKCTDKIHGKRCKHERVVIRK